MLKGDEDGIDHNIVAKSHYFLQLKLVLGEKEEEPVVVTVERTIGCSPRVGEEEPVVAVLFLWYFWWRIGEVERRIGKEFGEQGLGLVRVRKKRDFLFFFVLVVVVVVGE